MIRITLEGDKIIRERLEGIYPVISRLAIEQVGIPLLRAVQEASPKDTGGLAGSFSLEIESATARVTSPLIQGSVMEYGREAGAASPPPDALAGWVLRHGRDTGPVHDAYGTRTTSRIKAIRVIDTRRAALFAIARAIGRKGIAPRDFVGKALSKVESDWATLEPNIVLGGQRYWVTGASK